MVEVQLESVSFLAYRRVSAMITVKGPTAPSRQLALIDAGDLAAAIKRDAEVIRWPAISAEWATWSVSSARSKRGLWCEPIRSTAL